jgi:dTDP-glucose 4,6-dehydratase
LVRVLVTGGCGFIGSHFVKRLVSAGDEVVVLDLLTYAGNRANLTGVPHDFAHGDVADPDAVRAAADGCDAVVNFAAETHVDRSILGGGEFVHTNVAGTQVLLEWVRKAGVRFVQISTDEVYGDVQQGASTEGDPLRPSSPYAASKASADLLVLAYLRTFGIDACITRGSNAYGPFQFPEKLVPLFITNALEGRPLPVYGDGRQRRTWAYVEDQCAGIELVLRNGRAGEIYNVGGEERENLELSRLILELTGSSPDLVEHVEDRPGHDRRYHVDSSRIEALGWSPAASLGEGLARTVGWYRERQDWWAPLKAGEAAA